ncbi:uncharacterized protein LTR77_010689 [Saxophila tyrrhenica]|uniref:Protein kinase domain-containing protein n=1 Tax=Saxophila tyrrhenica TaxID=1690608 RepID=A0AAV9NV65_9PEZI|nr:hypothetical protein LTR77_010689 [Saxophila tyrrhenica]
MPADYEHLRTRLRIEQSRCLHWGQNVGLAEDLLDETNQLLRLNHNLVLDVLHEIQRSFRSCLEITTRYDPNPLQKIISFWKRSGRVVGRVEWAMLKKGSFEDLVTTLISYNDRIESLLDRKSLDDVRTMQVRSNLMLLQVTDKIDALHTLVDAIRVGREEPGNATDDLSRASTLVEPEETGKAALISLAEFKMHRLRMELLLPTAESQLIPIDSVTLKGPPSLTGRQRGMLSSKPVWLEWRESADEFMTNSNRARQVDARVQQLAAVLGTRSKPAIFRTLDCNGYTRVVKDGRTRYALVHTLPKERPSAGKVRLISLRELIEDGRVPSLSDRVELASALAASLLYLHVMDWVHKDVRSDNVLFTRPTDGTLMLTKPIVAGFEFSRPSVPDEPTVTHVYTLKQALYRHPDLLSQAVDRSTKSHDIYSLGLVMAEIALWRPIEEIVDIEVRRTKAMQVQGLVLNEDILTRITSRVGRKFCGAMQRCVDGSLVARVVDEAGDEESPAVAAEIVRLFHEGVVTELRSIKM